MEQRNNSVMRIHVSSTDKLGSKLLYQHIVEMARDIGISGATVHRGVMGYGSSSRISSSRFWELTEKLPVVIELVDRTSILQDFWDSIQKDLLNMPKGCLVLMEPARILLQKKGT